MAITRYLAMTAGEIQENSIIPGEIGYLACHFSPYSQGLSNLPPMLPEGSLLILDDMTPIQGHDPGLILQQLSECIQSQNCAALLLDFQREGYEEANALAKILVEDLPCPVAVTPAYAPDVSCAVCLPSVPPSASPEEYLSAWTGREIWLELALEVQQLQLREDGVLISPSEQIPSQGLISSEFHSHYQIEAAEDAAAFTFWRTREDLDTMLQAAEPLGVTTAVGLYQEFGDWFV